MGIWNCLYVIKKKDSFTRLIQISILEEFIFLYDIKMTGCFGYVERPVVLLSCLFVLWVCGEAGGALVLFVCTLSKREPKETRTVSDLTE
jgi:hypothetical protein